MNERMHLHCCLHKHTHTEALLLLPLTRRSAAPRSTALLLLSSSVHCLRRLLQLLRKFAQAEDCKMLLRHILQVDIHRIEGAVRSPCDCVA